MTRKLTLIAAVLALALSAVAGSALAKGGAHAAGSTTITLHDSYFSPKSVSVSKGSTLRFVWAGHLPHNLVGPGAKPLRQLSLHYPPRHEGLSQSSLSRQALGGAGLLPSRGAPKRARLAFFMTAATSTQKIRVVVAKPGLDGHDRGAKIIARALRDAGMEVIYTGLHQTPEQIVETVVQEDADAIGLSILSGAHMTLVPKIVDLLSAQGIDDVVVTVGGTIPADDIPQLKELGVAAVFTPGAPTQEIIDFLPTPPIHF